MVPPLEHLVSVRAKRRDERVNGVRGGRSEVARSPGERVVGNEIDLHVQQRSPHWRNIVFENQRADGKIAWLAKEVWQKL